jgi:hypothetical protein
VSGVTEKGVLAVVRKVIRRRIRRQEGGVNVAADVDAVVSVNTGESGQTSSTRVRSRRRIVQRSGGLSKNADQTGDTKNEAPEEKPPEGGE